MEEKWIWRVKSGRVNNSGCQLGTESGRANRLRRQWAVPPDTVQYTQGRPVNVKHDARCVMGKVGGEDKRPKQGGIFKILHNSFCDYKMLQNTLQPFVLFVICYCYYLVVTVHCCVSMTHRPDQGFIQACFWGSSPPKKTWNSPNQEFLPHR